MRAASIRQFGSAQAAISCDLASRSALDSGHGAASSVAATDRPDGTVGPPALPVPENNCFCLPGPRDCRLRPERRQWQRKRIAFTAKSDDAIERTAEKGPVKLFVRVQPREPRLSDLVEMEVTVESQPDVEIKPPAFGQAVGDFLIRDYSERPREAGAGNVRRFRYQLEPAHAGKHLIRSVSIEFVDRRPNSEGRGEPALIETDPLELNVTSELGDEAPSLANLEPMLPPQPVQGVFCDRLARRRGRGRCARDCRRADVAPPQAASCRAAALDS